MSIAINEDQSEALEVMMTPGVFANNVNISSSLLNTCEMCQDEFCLHTNAIDLNLSIDQFQRLANGVDCLSVDSRQFELKQSSRSFIDYVGWDKKGREINLTIFKD